MRLKRAVGMITPVDLFFHHNQWNSLRLAPHAVDPPGLSSDALLEDGNCFQDPNLAPVYPHERMIRALAPNGCTAVGTFHSFTHSSDCSTCSHSTTARS